MKLLDTAHNRFGLLDKSAKNRIRAYLNWPTQDGWSDIQNIVICLNDRINITVKMAVVIEDSSYCLLGPTFYPANPKPVRIPPALLTARAIKKQLEFVGDRFAIESGE